MLRLGRVLKSRGTARASALAATGAIGTICFIQLNNHEDIAKAETKDTTTPLNIPTRKTVIPSRDVQIANLSQSDKVFDVLIVGGGATGAGAALDATTRGLSTALIERGDFGNETSSRST